LGNKSNQDNASVYVCDCVITVCVCVCVWNVYNIIYIYTYYSKYKHRRSVAAVLCGEGESRWCKRVRIKFVDMKEFLLYKYGRTYRRRLKGEKKKSFNKDVFSKWKTRVYDYRKLTGSTFLPYLSRNISELQYLFDVHYDVTDENNSTEIMIKYSFYGRHTVSGKLEQAYVYKHIIRCRNDGSVALR